MCWLLSAVGVVCILVAHEHYTVDVVVAYFITSRLFYWYHTMANLQVRTHNHYIWRVHLKSKVILNNPGLCVNMKLFSTPVSFYICLIQWCTISAALDLTKEHFKVSLK